MNCGVDSLTWYTPELTRDQLDHIRKTAELRDRLIAKWSMVLDAKDTTNKPAMLIEPFERPLETTHD